MTYPRYIKRKGKVYGPYYYKSVRDDKGNVVNVYVGRSKRASCDRFTLQGLKPPGRSSAFLTALLIFLAIYLAPFLETKTTGFFSYSPKQAISETLAMEVNQFVPKGAVIYVQMENLTSQHQLSSLVSFPPENMTIGNETIEGYQIGILEIKTENLTAPDAEGNYTVTAVLVYNGTEIASASMEITVAREPEVSPEPRIPGNETTENVNQTAENATNVTVSENMTEQAGQIPEANQTIQANASEVEEEVVQYQAEINKPVKWVKKVRLAGSQRGFVVRLPESTLYANVSKVEKGLRGKIRSEIVKAGKFTEIRIDDEMQEIEVEYFTEAPHVREESLSSHRKRVTVYSETSYTNVLAYTETGDYSKESIKLYWIRGGLRELFTNVAYLDENGNGLVDRIEWTIPHLSNQTFEVEITILNVQSYPTVRGNWTVEFNTTGEANLTITAVNGTRWSDSDENNDLRFLEIKCGNQALNYAWIDNGPGNASAFVENYSCTENGYETSKVLTGGKHALEFRFGEDVEYAYNNATPIGIEYNSTSQVYHIWNEKDDYYVDAVSGIQITNHYQEYWTHNKWCVYVQLGTWRKACADEFSWTWYNSTDNLTYANLTGYASGSYPGGYRIDIIYEYYLRSNDTTIRITPTVLNKGKAFSGWLIWRVQDIQINMTLENDTIRVNSDLWWLNESLNLEYPNNVTSKMYRMTDNDTGEYLDLYWNESIWIGGINQTHNYTLKIKNESGQYNSPAELWSYIGSLPQDSNFTTNYRWIDAPPNPPTWTQSLADSPDPCWVPTQINYTGAGDDPNDDSYKMTVCRTNSITAGYPGTCASGQTLCASPEIPDLGQATCNYTTATSDMGTLTAYGFLCDPGSKCSTSTSTTTSMKQLPQFSSYNVNDSDVKVGEAVNHTVNITISPTYYLFNWNANGAGCDTWVNSSWVQISGSPSYYLAFNVSDIPAACAGRIIGWRFYANNSDGMNVSDIQNYVVTGCANLSDPSTYQNKLVSLHNRTFFVNDNISLCQNTYYTNTIHPFFIINNSNTILDCNYSTIVNTGLGTGILTSKNNTKTENCTFQNFSLGINILDINDSSNQTEWNWTQNPSTADDYVRSVAVDQEGNYVVGCYDNTTTGYQEWRVVKLWPNGTTIWNWTQNPSTGSDYAYSVAVDQEGNYVVGGADGSGLWRVVKLWPNGTTIWNWTQDPSGGDDRVYSVAVDQEGNYVVGGVADYSGDGRWRVVKMWPNGTTIWNWTQNPSTSYDYAYSVAVDQEGNYVAVGFEYVSPGNYQWRVVKLWPNGTTIWNWTQNPSASYDYLYSVAVDQEGNYVAVGHDNSLSNYQWRMVKLWPNGTTIWNWTQDPSGGSDSVQSVAVDQEGNYVAGGYDGSPGQWRVVKMWPNGTTIWNWTQNPSAGSDYAQSVAVDQEGNYVAGGADYYLGNYQWRVVKISPSKEPLAASLSNVSIYRQNITTYLSVNSSSQSMQISNLTIGYNQTVGKINFGSFSVQNGTLAFNRNIYLDTEVVSLDTSYSYSSGFNRSANVTVYKNGPCSDISYYKKTGFPRTKSEIKTGQTFSPSYSSCSDATGIVIFEVPDFTGYAPFDTVPPNLWFDSSTLANQSNTPNNWIFVNVSANENLHACILNWYNGASWTNDSIMPTGKYCYINKTGLSDGSYYFRVYGNDTTGHMNVTEDRQASVDVTPPYYQYDQDNSSGEVNKGEAVQSSAYWNDLLSDLGAAVLRTNETGSWGDQGYYSFAGKPEYSNFTISTEGYGGKTICWVIWANDTEGNMNSSMDLGGHCFNVIAGESTLTIESIVIEPDEGNPGIIINPVEDSNKSVNVTVTVTNSTGIDACEVRIFNSSASYSDPVFLYAGVIQNCAATCDCFKEWDMEYWRNDGEWNVSVYVNLTTGVGNFTSQNFTYNYLTSISVNTSSITFTGIPGQTVNSTNAYPLEIKNTGNQIVNISIKGTNFTGLSNPSYVVGVGNSTYNETQNGTFEQLTNDFAQIFEDLTPSGVRNLFFRAYLPLGFIQQDYQNTIEITT